MIPVTELVAENLKKIRTERKLSQEKLSELAGCSKNHISAIERGKKFPSAALLDKLIQILEVKPFYFFLDSEDTETIRVRETVIEYVMDSLDGKKLNKFLKTGDSSSLIE